MEEHRKRKYRWRRGREWRRGCGGGWGKTERGRRRGGGWRGTERKRGESKGEREEGDRQHVVTPNIDKGFV